NVNLQAKADKSALQQEVSRIKVIEEGLVDVNENLQIKADKTTVLEQFGAFTKSIETKAEKSTLENHFWSSDSHVSYLTRRDASNLDDKNVDAWKMVLGIFDSTEPGRKYKIYRALLYVEKGSFEPKFTVLENTIGDIEWSRKDVGSYTGKSEKAFPEGRVWINSKVNVPFKKISSLDCMAVRSDDHSVDLNIFNKREDYNPVDLEGEFGIIEIFVYDLEK
ncbi:hypothetical protein LPB85_06465, partial [Chryseobacterium sp. LC2016-27]|uniref:hypothetical protein n=1 Tax=Chryseobacterium sp. LC2016-27 TaxID=2897326 RepID=UPI001E5A84E2